MPTSEREMNERYNEVVSYPVFYHSGTYQAWFDQEAIQPKGAMCGSLVRCLNGIWESWLYIAKGPQLLKQALTATEALNGFQGRRLSRHLGSSLIKFSRRKTFVFCGSLQSCHCKKHKFGFGEYWFNLETGEITLSRMRWA